MNALKKSAALSSILLASLLLASCGKDDTDSEVVVEENNDLNYDHITQQLKIDSYLNKIEDYNFEGYFFPSGISTYDRTIMSKNLNSYFYNPYLYDILYAMTNGDLDENILIDEFNVLYVHMKALRDLTGDLRDVNIIEGFNRNETSLAAFKNQNITLKTRIHEVYDTIKNLEFETTEGKMLQQFHAFYLDYWMLEIDNQFETIKRLTPDKQKTYNVTDFTLRLSNYGEEASYVDTFIVLLEAKKIKDTGILEIEKKEKDKK